MRGARRGAEAEYGVSARPGPLASEAGEKFVSFACPLCKTRMSASPEQAGQSMECPDCGTAAIVPAASEAASATVPHRTADPSEEYSLWGVGQPPREVTEVHQVYIPVVCGLCQTRMLATEDQVGQTLACPDCGTEAIVPPPPPRAESDAAKHDVADAYEVASAPGPSRSGAAAAETHILVTCPLCHTRLHATPDQVGQEIACPDCLTRMTVPPPPPAARPIDPMEGADAGYAVTAPVRPPEWQPIFEVSWVQDRDDSPAEYQQRPRSDAEPSAVPWAAPSDAFGFLLSPGVLVRMVMFSAAAIAILVVAAVAAAMGSVATIGHYMVSMSFAGAAGVLTMMWVAAASATLLAVVVDTAAGNDRVENWPEGMFLDWLGDAFYVINALAVSVLPGVAAGWLLGASRAGVLSVAISIFCVFPIVLLSMLEWGSAVKPLSGRILGSLLTAPGSWALFYLQSAGLVLAAGGLMWVASLIACGLGGVLAAPVFVASLLIYFRLLGRLAWVGSEGAASCKSPRRRSG